MAGMSSVTSASISGGFKASCANNLTGVVYNPVSNSLNITKNYPFGTANANAAVSGGDEVFSFQQGIAAGSSATIDLTAMTNLLQQAGVNIARIKSMMIRLLSASDDSTINPAPNANSVVTITNNGPSVPASLYFGNNGSGLTLALTTSTGAITSVAIGSAGSGYPPSSTFIVGPNQTGGSGGVVNVTTNGSGVPTTVALVAGAGGSGYTNATVPSTVLGQFPLVTGGAALVIDVSAAGTTVSSTAKNLRIYNQDGTNAITVELDFFAATT